MSARPASAARQRHGPAYGFVVAVVLLLGFLLAGPAALPSRAVAVQPAVAALDLSVAFVSEPAVRSPGLTQPPSVRPYGLPVVVAVVLLLGALSLLVRVRAAGTAPGSPEA